METIKNTVNSLLGRTPTGPKVRYGVVGCGWISQAHFMPGILQTTNSEMTCLCTDDDTKLIELTKKYNIKGYKYADFNKMLEDNVCDALYIATPNWRHSEFAVPALEKGYHVLLEKPMEVSEAECNKIIEAQKKSGAKLMLAYRLHCEKGTLTVYDRIRKGDFGKVRIFSSVFTQPVKEDNHRAKHGFNAGPIPDIGPYPINAARHVFEDEPIEVSAMGFKNPQADMKMEHDTIFVTLRFPNERIGQLVCGYTTASTQHYHAVGDRGEIFVSPAFVLGEGASIAYTAKIDGKEESKQSFPTVDQFGGETEYFSDCILNNREVEPDGEEGLMDVRIIEAIKRSLANGGKVEKLEPRKRTKIPTLDQARELKQARNPKDDETVGRDSKAPVKQ